MDSADGMVGFEQRGQGVPLPADKGLPDRCRQLGLVGGLPGRDRAAANVDLQRRLGRSSIRLCSDSIWVAGKVRQGMPMVVQLPKKISAKLSPTMALMPRRMSACGACSRLEPEPKLRLTTGHWRR